MEARGPGVKLAAVGGRKEARASSLKGAVEARAQPLQDCGTGGKPAGGAARVERGRSSMKGDPASLKDGREAWIEAMEERRPGVQARRGALKFAPGPFEVEGAASSLRGESPTENAGVQACRRPVRACRFSLKVL